MDLLIRGARQLGVDLDASQIGQFARYYREIVEWNPRAGLMSVTAHEEVQTRHFLDSLTVSAAVPGEVLAAGGDLLDVGSGAGLPGIPLAIAYPELRVTLLEATEKKAAFLAHVTGALGLESVKVGTGRAETLAHDPGLRERFDLVASRSVARLSVLAELTLPFCRIGGRCIAQKSVGVEEEIEEARGALGGLGAELGEVMQVTVPCSGVTRLLVCIDKVAPTTSRYPRRPGIPSKRPL